MREAFPLPTQKSVEPIYSAVSTESCRPGYPFKVKGKTPFAQVIGRGRVGILCHRGDAGVRILGCAELFHVMAFAQSTRFESGYRRSRVIVFHYISAC